RDAVLSFDLPSDRLSARAVFDVTLALLAADFAEVVDAASILSA
ncbi:MAG: cysteine hydrolase, partial [Anaerolineae bacterium]|nr:cysteine hydrolase [Anaerolineae bacterium]